MSPVRDFVGGALCAIALVAVGGCTRSVNLDATRTDPPPVHVCDPRGYCSTGQTVYVHPTGLVEAR